MIYDIILFFGGVVLGTFLSIALFALMNASKQEDVALEKLTIYKDGYQKGYDDGYELRNSHMK